MQWGLSSVGRASDSSPEGHRFKSGSPHLTLFYNAFNKQIAFASCASFFPKLSKKAMHMKIF